MSPTELVDAVVQQYLTSGDYNGLPIYSLTRSLGLTLEELRLTLVPLIEASQLSVNFGDGHPNPHIRALADRPIEEQVAKLIESTNDTFVLYPTAQTLSTRVATSDYEGRPFSFRLARGAPQLEYGCFDPAVLDQYRRDPRYRFWTNDIQATLSIGNEAYESISFPEKHKVLIQDFGFAYSDEFSRVVAVFLRDLDRLTPEHQQVWAASEVDGRYKLHPGFWRAAIAGDWDIKASLREAFLEEIRAINEMCHDIGWQKLFRQDFSEAPRELGFLLRPTLSEFNSFVLVLDKIMSDNLSREFFPTTIPREEENTRSDGKIVVRQRGSIAILEEWLKTSFRTRDIEPLEELIRTFKRVRKLRQKPAHSIDDDAYDQGLFEQQRQLFLDAYAAVRTIRLVLQNHPRARRAMESMDERVQKGEIWSY